MQMIWVMVACPRFGGGFFRMPMSMAIQNRAMVEIQAILLSDRIIIIAAFRLSRHEYGIFRTDEKGYDDSSVTAGRVKDGRFEFKADRYSSYVFTMA